MKITKQQLRQIIKEEASLLEAEGSAEELIKRLVKVHKDVASGEGSVGDAEAERQLRDLAARDDGFKSKDIATIAKSILAIMPEVGKPDKSGQLSGFLGQRIGYLYSALRRAR